MAFLRWFRAVQAPSAGVRVSGARERMRSRVWPVQRFSLLPLARLLGRALDRQSQRRAPKAAWEVVVPVSVVLTLPAPPRELRH